MMKIIKNVLVLTTLTAVSFFLLFSFSFGTLNFLEWGIEGRKEFSILVGVSFIVFLVIIAVHNEVNKSSK